jgi:tRNA uridine 5-carboxymethylaminomethyl modification enzyme
LRLTEKGREIGLVDDYRWDRFVEKREAIRKERQRLETSYVYEADNGKLAERFIRPVSNRTTYSDLMKRPEVDYSDIAWLTGESAPRAVAEQVEIMTKYEGYITRQLGEVAASAKREDVEIPTDLDFAVIRALSNEGREKLGRVRPVSLGQASRIPGVTSADISILGIYIEQKRRIQAAKKG